MFSACSSPFLTTIGRLRSGNSCKSLDEEVEDGLPGEEVVDGLSKSPSLDLHLVNQISIFVKPFPDIHFKRRIMIPRKCFSPFVSDIERFGNSKLRGLGWT